MRVAVEAGARVGEEAGDDAGRGDGLQACLEAAIAEEAARLVFAGGEAAPRCTRVGQGDGHAPDGDGDLAADQAGVVLATPCDRKSVVSGKSVAGRVYRGGRRMLKKKKNTRT